MNEIEIIGVIAALVKNLICAQVDGLKLKHNGCLESLRSASEELDFLEDFTVGLCNYLISEMDREA